VRSGVDDLLVLNEFFEEGEAADEDVENQYNQALKLIEDLEFMKMLSGEEDRLNAILQINPGAGGTESQDWASMLMRMYIRWGERNDYKVKELDFLEGDVAGIKSVSLEFEGAFAFGYLKAKTVFTAWSGYPPLMRPTNDILPSPRYMYIPWWMRTLRSRSILQISHGTPFVRVDLADRT
jgi:hypothetical protein